MKFEMPQQLGLFALVDQRNQIFVADRRNTQLIKDLQALIKQNDLSKLEKRFHSESVTIADHGNNWTLIYEFNPLVISQVKTSYLKNLLMEQAIIWVIFLFALFFFLSKERKEKQQIDQFAAILKTLTISGGSLAINNDFNFQGGLKQLYNRFQDFLAMLKEIIAILNRNVKVLAISSSEMFEVVNSLSTSSREINEQTSQVSVSSKQMSEDINLMAQSDEHPRPCRSRHRQYYHGYQKNCRTNKFIGLKCDHRGLIGWRCRKRILRCRKRDQRIGRSK